jgi:hypothetical protein
MMRARSFASRALVAGCCLAAASANGNAAEYGFSTYGLGESAFSAGVTPPAGIYVTNLYAYYEGEINKAVSFGGVTINAGAAAKAFSTGINILYVPDSKIFGGNLGLSVTMPVGHVDVAANVTIGAATAAASTQGWGLADIVPRAQLGWQSGDFAHTIYVEVITPTGFWKPGFEPIIGFHRPGIDTGWAFTWVDKPSKIQLNGTAGFTFNFENTATNYQSGNEFHWEWAIGREVTQGLVLGIVGYDYRQLERDSGPTAIASTIKAQVDAIGAGVSYTTVIDKTPVIFNLRHYQEFNGKDRFEGNSTLGSATVRF